MVGVAVGVTGLLIDRLRRADRSVGLHPHDDPVADLPRRAGADDRQPFAQPALGSIHHLSARSARCRPRVLCGIWRPAQGRDCQGIVLGASGDRLGHAFPTAQLFIEHRVRVSDPDLLDPAVRRQHAGARGALLLIAVVGVGDADAGDHHRRAWRADPRARALPLAHSGRARGGAARVRVLSQGAAVRLDARSGCSSSSPSCCLHGSHGAKLRRTTSSRSRLMIGGALTAIIGRTPGAHGDADPAQARARHGRRHLPGLRVHARRQRPSSGATTPPGSTCMRSRRRCRHSSVPPTYPGEQLLMWWNNDQLKELREPIGIYHAFFDSLPSDLGDLTPLDKYFFSQRHPAQILLMSLNGPGLPGVARLAAAVRCAARQDRRAAIRIGRPASVADRSASVSEDAVGAFWLRCAPGGDGRGCESLVAALGRPTPAAAAGAEGERVAAVGAAQVRSASPEPRRVLSGAGRGRRSKRHDQHEGVPRIAEQVKIVPPTAAVVSVPSRDSSPSAESTTTPSTIPRAIPYFVSHTMTA